MTNLVEVKLTLDAADAAKLMSLVEGSKTNSSTSAATPSGTTQSPNTNQQIEQALMKAQPLIDMYG